MARRANLELTSVPSSNGLPSSPLPFLLAMAPLSQSSRKRKTAEPEASTSSSKSAVPDNLALGGDEEDGEEHTDDEAVMDEDEEPFPELDLGSSDEDDGEFADGEGGEEDEGEDSEDEDEEGYNSSDIDALDNDSGNEATSPPPSLTHSRSTAHSRSSRSRSKSPISHFIAENTSKPDERDPSIILRPEDERAGVWTVSQLTGRPKRVYPDIEAGYGSESSTEDVSNSGFLLPLSSSSNLGSSHFPFSFRSPSGSQPCRRYPLPLVRRPSSHRIRRERQEGHEASSGRRARPLPLHRRGPRLLVSSHSFPLLFLLELRADTVQRLLFQRTSVPDKLLHQNTALTDAELDIIRRLQNAENPDENYDPYAPTVEWYTSHEEVMPLSSRPEPKARFVASKWEHKKVSSPFRRVSSSSPPFALSSPSPYLPFLRS